MMNFKSLSLLLACFSIVFLYNCQGNYACQSPPPTLHFVLLDKNDKDLITNSNKDLLRIWYVDASNIKQYINDLGIGVRDSASASNPYQANINSYDIVFKSYDLKDPAFNLELSGNIIGKINLKTFLDNNECSGWKTASEVRFNDKLIQRDNKTGIFMLKIE